MLLLPNGSVNYIGVSCEVNCLLVYIANCLFPQRIHIVVCIYNELFLLISTPVRNPRG